MRNCYDRSSERQKFIASKKDVVIFLNSQGNGMSTFLYNMLNNNQYIFIRENYTNDIIFDFGDNRSTSYAEVRKEFLDFQINALEDSKIALNLFYFIDQGTFWRNLSVDIANRNIRQLNNRKYSFENFLSEYILYCKSLSTNNEPIYLIIDHADNVSYTFMSKVKSLLPKGNIKIIICLSSPIARAEISKIFDDYDEIDFSMPSFEKALVIFQNLKFDSSFYNSSMYEGSNNIFEFIKKYQINVKAKKSDVDQAENILDDFLSQITCLFSKSDFELICKYLMCNSLVDKYINAEKLFNQYIYTNKIISNGGLYRFVLTKDKEELNIFGEPFYGLASYLLNFSLSYNLLSYLFFHCKDRIDFDCNNLIRLLGDSDSIVEINEIIENLNKNQNLSYLEYLNINKILFEKRFYNLLFTYPNTTNVHISPFNRLFQIVVQDKKHLEVNPKIYRKALISCLKYYSEIDLKCLFVVLYLDFCINHNKKQIRNFFNPHNILFYENYQESKYYYILESIIAFYVNNEDLALKLYDEAIGGKDTAIKTYLLNNKFVYLLRYFINLDRFETEVNNVVKDLYALDHNVYSDNFLNTNILLYKSISSKQNHYNLTEIWNKEKNSYHDDLQTWDIYKILNAKILDFLFSSDFNMENYVTLEHIVQASNRAPTKNIYYYNLFIIATCCGDNDQKKKAKKFLNHNKDFRFSNIYEIYKSIKSEDTEYFKVNKQKLVRYGYIFSRIIEINHLFSEMAVLIK